MILHLLFLRFGQFLKTFFKIREYLIIKIGLQMDKMR